MAETATTPDLAEVRERVERLVTEVHRVIIGQDGVIRHLLCALFSRGHCLLIGVPGLAKTRLVKTLAESLDWEFRRVQFTPDLMPGDLLGTEILDTEPGTDRRSFRFVPGPIFANLLLADEINRTPPKTQSALLEAMQESAVTVGGRTRPLEPPFFVVATQNPIEQEGTYPLPEAQLDRFMYSLSVEYPSATDEERIAVETTRADELHVNRVFSRTELLSIQRLVREVPVSPHVVQYAVRLARASRPDSPEAPAAVKRCVQWGAGPRASQYLTLGARALAVLQGKPVPTAADVRAVAPLVLQHRIIPNYSAVADDVSAQRLVEEILKAVPEPDYRPGRTP